MNKQHLKCVGIIPAISMIESDKKCDRGIMSKEAKTFSESVNFNTTDRFRAKSKYILLVCKEKEVQENTRYYALNLCHRIGATLNIFYLSQEITAQQCCHALLRYVQKKTTVIGIVINSVDGLDISKKWSIIDCPLIIVNESIIGNIKC